MINSSQPGPLSIRRHDVKRQFERRGDLASAEFLYGEIAQRMFERLKLIRLEPGVVLDAGCGNGKRLSLLRARYPNAKIMGIDHSDKALEQARQLLAPPWWRALLPWQRHRLYEYVCADLASSGLAPGSIDLIWSNLAIHWHPEPHNVLREWSRILKPGGLALFSNWGPATGQELRTAISRAGIQTATLPLVDMHDLGDLMIEQGFADPVMDQETITLTYADGASLLADVSALGGNPNPNRRAGLTTKGWRARLIEALEANARLDGKLTLTLEVAYGHAWRSTTRRSAGETLISVEAIGRKPQ
jgi:malonyl-CoA O-methyltransferase